MMFQVINTDRGNLVLTFEKLNEAAAWAEHLKRVNGNHYHVVKLETVYTTQAIKEIMEG